MARTAREKSEYNTYLVILKGDTELTFDDEDKANLLGTAVTMFFEDGAKVLAYSFDDCDFRFVVLDGGKFENTIKRIGISFASFYNKKRNRVGSIFRDRFESIPAKTEKDVFYMISAVHFCTENQKFNSNTDYFSNEFVASKLVLKKFVVKRRLNNYLKDIKASEEVQKLIKKIATKYEDKDIEKLIEKEIETTVDEISSLPDDNVRSALEKVFQFTTASVRQVVNITGLPFRLVYSALKATATAPVKMTKKLLKRKDKKQEKPSIILEDKTNKTDVLEIKERIKNEK